MVPLAKTRMLGKRQARRIPGLYDTASGYQEIQRDAAQGYEGAYDVAGQVENNSKSTNMALKEKNIVPKWNVDVRQNGEIIFRDPDSWKRYKIPFHGKPAQLILKKVTKLRSRQEEKFYHAVVVRMVAEAMEVSRDDAHEFLKDMFLKREEKTPTGMRYKRILSTTELSDAAYREYWEQCIRWAALPTKDEGLGPDSGLELYIPYPNEVDYENAM
jgi:hypothetical protein